MNPGVLLVNPNESPLINFEDPQLMNSNDLLMMSSDLHKANSFLFYKKKKVFEHIMYTKNNK